MNETRTAMMAGDRPLRFLALAVLCLLVAVAGLRLGGYRPAEPAPGPVVSSRQLVVEDLGEGRVALREHPGGRPLLLLAAGEGSFIRGVLRGLARERRSLGLGTEAPFQLSRHRDGHLRLEDPATGQRIDLQAFGPSNEGAFAPLLEDALAQR
jgi:putative photosynthetic complex assembly protein